MQDFEHSLPMLLYRTLDNVLPAFRRIFAEFDLTEPQWRILRVLWERDARPLGELAAVTLLPAPSLVGIVDRMADKKLLRRRRDANDRRVVHVCLAAAGRRLEGQVRPRVADAYEQIQSRLSATEWRELQRLLARFWGTADDAERRKTG